MSYVNEKLVGAKEHVHASRGTVRLVKRLINAIEIECNEAIASVNRYDILEKESIEEIQTKLGSEQVGKIVNQLKVIDEIGVFALGKVEQIQTALRGQIALIEAEMSESEPE